MCECANCDPDYLYAQSYPNGDGPFDVPPVPVTTGPAVGDEPPW